MSTIIHQENTNLFDPLNRGNITISQNLSSSPVNLNGYSLFTIQHVWSGASGTWSVIIEGSNELGEKNDNDYTVIDTTLISGTNGNHMLNFEKAGFAFVRARIAYTSGTGTFKSILNGKIN